MSSHTRNPLRPIDWVIILLAGATGLIHFYLGFSELGTGDPLLPVSFILNGLAYWGLIIALYFVAPLKRYHGSLQWALIALATATIVLYFVFNGIAGLSSPLGMVTKGIELALIIVLVFDIGR